MQIEDRVFVVTGASSGIGLATATALSGRGANVAQLARSMMPWKHWRDNYSGSPPLSVDMTQFDRLREAVQVAHRSNTASAIRAT
jgi:NADP-dependent 3-hydroxy acid dehydrogenase YdfG